ncbi:hypothetical protein M514_23096 [Trichuris suis]|uniref:Uncharacterized protein n=1 Tax=Trichuris suis TaxID=68888 RepID=A0A085N5M7_9BILA|nr:hypothetical protein M514_23096 [Trichuris suis]
MRLLLFYTPLMAFVLLRVMALPTYTGDADPSIVDEVHLIKKRHPHEHHDVRLRRSIPRGLIRRYRRPVIRPSAIRPFIPPALRPSLRLVGR